MKFNEEKFRDLSHLPLIFIYFLIKQEEVVYVGQTTKGLLRVYQHHYNKDFDDIYIIECNSEDLDKYESYYIFKYEPIYNNNPNYLRSCSIGNLIKKIKEIKSTSTYNWTQKRIKNMLDKFNISPKIFKGKQYITTDECQIILKYIEENNLKE